MACCAEERACAASAPCVTFVNCENCKTGSCIDSCRNSGDAGSPDPFGALAMCSKSAAFMPPAGVRCDWPQ
jgi:hypothetical protein